MKLNKKEWKKLGKKNYKIKKENINKENQTADTFLSGGLMGMSIGLMYTLLIGIILEKQWIGYTFFIIWLVYIAIGLFVMGRKENVVYVKN